MPTLSEFSYSRYVMLKFKSSHQFRSLLVPSLQHDCRFDSFDLLHFPVVIAFFTSSPNTSYTSPKLADYLTNSLKFPETEAVAFSKRFPSIDSTEKPKSVVRYLKSLGLSLTQLQSTIKRQPTILFTDVEKTLKPKVAFYQEMGVRGPNLGILLSKNSSLLTSSLQKKVKPSIGVIKRVIELYGSKKDNDDVNGLVFRILSRNRWFIAKGSRLESNISYLQSCGVVGSQLIMLLKNELGLVSMRENEVKNLVSRAVGMGFEMGSRMLVYGILALYSNSAETINRKFELLRGFGFSKDECDLIFVKSPTLFLASEGKLRRGIEFFTNTLMFDKSVLVGSSSLLKFSVEKRMIPRFKVLEMIKSRRLLEKEPSFVTVLLLPEKEFVEKFILRFGDDDAKELQMAYKKHLLES